MWDISEKQRLYDNIVGCKNKAFAGVWIEKGDWYSHGQWLSALYSYCKWHLGSAA